MPIPRNMSWPRRLISPSGLVLVLLCLFFPFVGVSCESSLGTLEVQVTGWDMVTNGTPSVTGTGMLGESAPDAGALPEEYSGNGGTERVGVQPLLLIGVLAVLTGIVLATLLQSAFARSLSGLIATAAAAVFIGVNEIVVITTLAEEISEGAPWAAAARPSEMVGTRFGFWITLGLLGAITVYNAVESIVSRLRPQAFGNGAAQQPYGPVHAQWPQSGPHHPYPQQPGPPPPGPQQPYPGPPRPYDGPGPPSGPYGPFPGPRQ